MTSRASSAPSATFCGVFPGNGWGHIETPILLGCIPVVVQDNILTPWENVLNFSAFGVRLSRRDLPRLPEILRAIPEARVAQMQVALRAVWERFTYSSLAIAERDRACKEDGSRSRTCLDLRRGLSGVGGEATGKDAVDTLMHVLHQRLLVEGSAGRGR